MPPECNALALEYTIPPCPVVRLVAPASRGFRQLGPSLRDALPKYGRGGAAIELEGVAGWEGESHPDGKHAPRDPSLLASHLAGGTGADSRGVTQEPTETGTNGGGQVRIAGEFRALVEPQGGLAHVLPEGLDDVGPKRREVVEKQDPPWRHG